MPYLRELLRDLIEREQLEDYVLWFYTPMALRWPRICSPQAVIYDCMDELSAFLNAPPELLEREAAASADGRPGFHRRTEPVPRQEGPASARSTVFPSSVDAKHFAAAANGMRKPEDQAALPHPRLGFFGVIDERFDVPLLRAMADAHPEWQLVMVGPVVKIDPDVCRRNPNIHYYGQRTYQQLPSYLEGLGCLPAAIRAQRVDAIYQPDEDAGVHGGGEDDRQHADYGCGGAVWRHRVSGRHARGVHRGVRAGAERGRRANAAAGRSG